MEKYVCHTIFRLMETPVYVYFKNEKADTRDPKDLLFVIDTSMKHCPLQAPQLLSPQSFSNCTRFCDVCIVLTLGPSPTFFVMDLGKMFTGTVSCFENQQCVSLKNLKYQLA